MATIALNLEQYECGPLQFRDADAYDRHVVFGAGQSDGDHCLRIIAVPGDQNAVVVHRRRNDVVRQPGAFPELSARGDVITAHALRCADDDLRLALVFDDERSGPGGFFIARNFPESFAGMFVQGV